MIHESAATAMVTCHRFAWAACLLMLSFAALSMDAPDSPGQLSSALFSDSAPLVMDMRLDLDRICLDPEGSECPDMPAEISYALNGETPKSLRVSVRTRGRWRKETGGCSFPALFVHVPPQQARGTVFEGESTLALTTHCMDRREYQDYALTEYLAYRLYQRLSEHSLRTRLLRVTYRDANGKPRIQRYAFFSEHFNRFAERTGTQFYRAPRIRPEETDPEEMATLSVFQYMIGNLDWSVLTAHNIALFRNPAGITTPVPFDFDYAGIVDARYALPPPGSGLSSVRSRLYRGFCWPGLDWSAIFAKFQAARTGVFAELAATPGLSSRKRTRVKSYLESFYRTIDSEKLRRQKITGNCREIIPARA